MEKPIIILNLKAYKEGMNSGLYSILNIVESVSSDFQNISFAIAPNPIFLLEAIRRREKTLIFAQHADPYPYGAYTGHIPLVLLKDIGIDGVIINHSEHKVSHETIERLLELSRTHMIKSCSVKLMQILPCRLFSPHLLN